MVQEKIQSFDKDRKDQNQKLNEIKEELNKN
jgi:hypothetical protein